MPGFLQSSWQAFRAADLATEIHIAITVFLIVTGFGLAVYGIAKVIRLICTDAEAFRKE